eukprot:4408556-Amphidinium_carterae.1
MAFAQGFLGGTCARCTEREIPDPNEETQKAKFKGLCPMFYELLGQTDPQPPTADELRDYMHPVPLEDSDGIRRSQKRPRAEQESVVRTARSATDTDPEPVRPVESTTSFKALALAKRACHGKGKDSNACE